NILKVAARYGKVIVGLFTDEAIVSYKNAPSMSYDQRKIVVENLKQVYKVVPQVNRDYEENLRSLKPDFMVHGKDWREGPLADVRAKAIRVMSEWDGQVIEPDYTKGVSSSQIKNKLAQR
ncbi:MAG: phosphoenolpyruvate phosphomutase, partial [Selenomonadaceae bacterium]|nr:phosphoenolpyruvate phosphomutase [Selenomonadaceae bacterium]